MIMTDYSQYYKLPNSIIEFQKDFNPIDHKYINLTINSGITSIIYLPQIMDINRLYHKLLNYSKKWLPW